MEVGGQRHTAATLLPGRGLAPIQQEAGWAPEPVWTFVFGEEKNLLPPLGFEPRTVQPVAYTEFGISHRKKNAGCYKSLTRFKIKYCKT